MPALTGFPHSWRKFLEWKSPQAESIRQKRSSVDAVWPCTSSEPFPEAGPTWGRWFMRELALQWLSRGPHWMVGQSWAGVCCLQVTRDFVHRRSSKEGTPSLEGLLWCLRGNLSESLPAAVWDYPCWDFALQQAWPCSLSHSCVGRWHHRCVFVVTLTAGSAGLGVTVPAPSWGTAGHWDRCALKDWETVGSAMPLPWVTREMQWITSLDLNRVLPWEILAVGCPCSNTKELLPPGRMICTDPFFPFNFHPLLYLQRPHSTRNSFVEAFG